MPAIVFGSTLPSRRLMRGVRPWRNAEMNIGDFLKGLAIDAWYKALMYLRATVLAPNERTSPFNPNDTRSMKLRDYYTARPSNAARGVDGF